MRHSNPVLQPEFFFFFGGKMHGQLRCRLRLFGGRLHRQLRLIWERKTKNNFEDDKMQSQFM